MTLQVTHCQALLLEPRHRFMDPLAGGSDESSSSGSDSDDAQEAKRPKPAAKSQPEVDPESLVCGTSVFFVPEPKQDGQQAWDW